jgi:TolB-like protein
VTEHSHAVFLSYASQDAEAAQRIAEALRAAGIEVWFDQSELRGGESWDGQIRERIHDCRLFIAVISAHTEARDEGYFRREWKLAVDRTHDMHEKKAFLVPVVIDGTSERGACVPEKFREVQWTRLPGGEATPAFVSRIGGLVGSPAADATGTKSAPLLTPSIPRRSVSRRVWVWPLLAILAISLVSVWFLWSHKSVPTAAPPASASARTAPEISIPKKSVAVLPFVDMSEKHDQQYFADGLSEELIDHLAHTPDLKVIARTSSFQFKGRNEDMRTIGESLGVANLLEGSVRTSGKTIRVTAQLIKAADGSHLWSETYDRDIRDIFKVQDTIAAAVVGALQVALATSVTRERSVNTEAYKALLRGRYFLQMGTKQDSERAVAALREAIDLDPEYATAFAELAIAYDLRGLWSWMPIKQAHSEARAAIDHSLKIDPTLAIAHRALGWIERDFNYDFVTWRVEQKRADELDPASPLVLSDAGSYAFIAGHLDEAIRVSRLLVERDPLATDEWQSLWLRLIRADRLAEAETAARRVLELNPRYGFAHGALALVLLYQHKPDAALAIARQETDELARSQVLMDVLWALGRRSEADTLLAELKAKYGESQAFVIAERYAVRNENDQAFLWLDRAYENRVPEVTLIRTDESLRNLHDDPRWMAFLRRLKLPE